MFQFSTGRSAFPNIYTVHAKKQPSNVDDTPHPPSTAPAAMVEASLEPAINGPPSPKRIRAYTEQMKRSSIFGNNSRTNTLSSATSSFRSQESRYASAESLSLSRRSSGRSSASSMPSNKPERRDSVHLFGSIFSRGSRRGRRDTNALTAPPSTTDVTEESDERLENQISAGRTSISHRSPPISLDIRRKKQLISSPYNFQHLTHTRQEHLPDLQSASGVELVSQFSAISASQLPTQGKLKGIRAQELRDVNGQDMYFENFSSEAINTPPTDLNGASMDTTAQGRQRSILRKALSLQKLNRELNHESSNENSEPSRSPQPRPSRSPLSPTCPIPLPLRTSSRTASVLLDNVDLLPITSIDRPTTQGAFRRPAPFGIPISIPQSVAKEQEHQFSNALESHAVTTPGDEAWPLTASTTSPFGSELRGIKEEDEEYLASRKSRGSKVINELRLSQSVPALRRRALDEASRGSETRMSTTLGRSPSNGTLTHPKSPLTAGFQFHDSWEDDIDFMYQQEAEADCDYQWDSITVCDGVPGVTGQSTPVQPASDLQLRDDGHFTSHGRHRPVLFVPSVYDPPALSPLGSLSADTSPEVCTPNTFLRPQHIRSPSHASTFKESQGFTLSPTLLVPSDFQHQSEQDGLYDEHYNYNPVTGTIFQQEPYHHPASPVEEATSSTASLRSSNLSGHSARSSSSTHISSTANDDSVLLQRAASDTQTHRSIGSAVSLPDLIPSRRPKTSGADDKSVAEGMLAQAPQQVSENANPKFPHFSRKHRYSKSLVEGESVRNGIDYITPIMPPLPSPSAVDVQAPFPVVEAPSLASSYETIISTHGRKTSAPESPTVKEFKGRARAATSASASSRPVVKKRTSYMLFPPAT